MSQPAFYSCQIYYFKSRFMRFHNCIVCSAFFFSKITYTDRTAVNHPPVTVMHTAVIIMLRNAYHLIRFRQYPCIHGFIVRTPIFILISARQLHYKPDIRIFLFHVKHKQCRHRIVSQRSAVHKISEAAHHKRFEYTGKPVFKLTGETARNFSVSAETARYTFSRILTVHFYPFRLFFNNLQDFSRLFKQKSLSLRQAFPWSC